MIFVTVGCQLPFPRLMEYVERYYEYKNEMVIAQVGNDKKKYKNIKIINYMSDDEYNDVVCRSKLIIGHCGTGTIYTAIKHRKKLIVIPREKKFGEHRSDHQIDTAEIFKSISSIKVVTNYKNFEDSINFNVQIFDEVSNKDVARSIASDIEKVLSN
jgi:UDP-N-acetylglucosamine transferase subunit ALG13